MLPCTAFIEKSKIRPILKKPELRDDIFCGSSACAECPDTIARLEVFPHSSSHRYKKPHYIIPDSNVLINQFDILGQSAFRNVIILQTVLEELRRRHSPVYSRVREAVSDANRHFYAFLNEHHRYTYTERKPGESYIKRNVRAICNAVKWYQEHLKFDDGHAIDVILLINDKESSKIADEEGLIVYTFAEYVKGMTKFPYLTDILANVDVNTKNDGPGFIGDQSEFRFPKYQKLAHIQDCLKAGTLIQGKFQASRENYLEGFVFMEGDDESESKSVFIQGYKQINRAVHGDLVAVQILPEDQWTCPSSSVLEETAKTPDVEKNETEKNVKKKMSPLKILSGAVVCILKRYQRLYYGMLQPLSIKGQATQTGEYLFMPEDVMIPSIYIITQEGEKLLSQRIEVSLDNWPRDSRYPQGSFIQSLDDVEDKGTVFQLEPNFPHQKFSQEVIDCLPQLPWVITEQDLLLRKDFRELAICSIDAPGTKVFDDALHCRKLENGNYELGVHISDVSHFLKRGTAVDREAAMRGASVNLENHMILMLPKMLTTNLCSLKENAERFAFSVIWEMTEGAEILSSSFLKSVIKSKAALTHSEAQLRIDDKSLDDEVTISLRLLDELAKLLKKQRIDNGEKSTMVEEFMLLANISVAKRILQAFPDSAVLKTKPEKFNFEPLIKAGLSKGFKIKVNSREELFESLSAAVLPENPQFNKMLRIIATQCMAQSLYVVSGLVSVSEYFHHGLVVPIYTHFTSPIRRYPDVIVHRLLAVAIGAEDPYPSLLDKNKTQVLCKELNQKLALTDLYQHIFSKGKAVEGHVLFIQENALQVLLPRFSLVSTFYLQSVTSSDGEAIFAYDEEGPTLSAAGITIRQFDPVTIQLHIDKTNVQHQKKSRKLIKNLMLEFNVPPLIEQSSSALEQQSPKQPPLKKQKTTEGDTED